ncbi:hypothetical protein [Nitrospirillum amazonense]|nr:hypothetical protein [Nitrospirillum amazonense]MDG3441083.1 hypothetical protein [Nitrospirillum amazonense]
MSACIVAAPAGATATVNPAVAHAAKIKARDMRGHSNLLFPI